LTARRAITGPGSYALGNTCAQVIFTPGALGSVTQITATVAFTYPTAQRNGLPRHYHIESDGAPITATLNLCYTTADLAAAGLTAHEAALALYRYDSATGTWEAYPSIVNPAAQRISATVTHFSTWAIGAPGHNVPTAVSVLALPQRNIVAAGIGAGLLLIILFAVWRARQMHSASIRKF